MKHIQDLFKNHPTENTIHVTSDGNAFFNQNYADSHASSLEKKEVQTITREVAENFEENVLATELSNEEGTEEESQIDSEEATSKEEDVKTKKQPSKNK